MIYCPNCGIANRDGSRFCNECGTVLPTSAGIKCPMCSTLNPPGTVFCDHCGARLVAAFKEPDASAPEPGAATPARRGLSLPTKPEAGEPTPAPDSTAAVPDWMRDSSSTEQPEWLQRLAGYSVGADQVENSPATENETPMAVPNSTPPDQPKSPTASEPPVINQSPADQVPDWMANLRAVPSIDSTDEPLEPAEPPTESAASPTPDWLNNLRAAPAGQEASLPPSEEPPAELSSTSAELPEWLSQLSSPSAATAQPAEESGAPETPDWLRDLSSAPTTAEPIMPAANSEMPDWLRDLSGAPAAAQEPVPTEPAAESEMPDWLRDLSGAPVAAQEPAPAASTDESDTPEWLRNISAGPDMAEASDAPEPTLEMPEWLREERSSLPPSESSSVSIEPPPVEPAAETPDWLTALRTAPSASSEPPAKTSSQIDRPAKSIGPQAKPGSTLDQITRSAPIAPAARPGKKIEPAAANPIGGVQATPTNELPVWLQGLNQQPTTEAKPRGPVVPIPPELPPELREEPEGAVALPDWLQALRKDAPAGTGAGAGLVQGEIPDWLQALRPSEDTSEFAGEIPETESEGVLAGITSALPSISLISEVQGLPAKLKIETSAQDLARAGMLQELLARGAAKPKPVTIRSDAGTPLRRRIGQWLVAAIILIVAMGFPAWTDLNQTLGFKLLPRLDQLPTGSVRSAFNTIDQLPDQATALVIFDYDPTQAGEMNPIADVLLRHLIARGVTVNVASLNPLGSSLAQTMWLKASAEISSSVQFKNLGYVAGQSIGVQQLLASNPSINVVIDLAASSDSLRWWVEQLAAIGSPVPLIAGLSAGAEPLALPYVRSGQVKGLVTGMVNALIYEQYAGLAPLASTDQATENQIHLEAQTLAHWVMAVIILIGLLSALFSRGGRRSTV